MKLTSTTKPEDLDSKLELLEDGMIQLTVFNKSNQATLLFYLAPAAAAEEPAA